MRLGPKIITVGALLLAALLSWLSATLAAGDLFTLKAQLQAIESATDAHRKYGSELKEVAAETAETLEDLAAEAKAELAESPAPKKPRSKKAAAKKTAAKKTTTAKKTTASKAKSAASTAKDKDSKEEKEAESKEDKKEAEK